MWSGVIGGVEPAGEGVGALARGRVDGAVGPAGQQGADEALGLAVGAGSAGPDAEVAKSQAAAGERVQRGDIAGAVIGHHALDVYAVAAIPDPCAAQEADRGCGLLVGEDFDVGQAGGVVDAHVHILVADPLGAPPLLLAAAVAVRAVSGPVDPSQLLDIDVDELAWVSSLVAVGRLGRVKPTELAQPHPAKHRRHRRERHVKRLADLRSRKPQLAKDHDRLHPLRRRLARRNTRTR